MLIVELRGRILRVHSAVALGGLTAPPVKCSSLRLCFMEMPELTATRGCRLCVGGVSTGWEADLVGTLFAVADATGSEVNPLAPGDLGDSSELLRRRCAWTPPLLEALGETGEL